MFNNNGGFTLNGGAFNNVNGNQYNNNNNTTNHIAGDKNDYRTENHGNNNVSNNGSHFGSRQQAQRIDMDGHDDYEDERDFYLGRPGLDHSATYPGYGRSGYDPGVPRYEAREGYRGYEGYRGGSSNRGYGPSGYGLHDPYHRPQQEAYHNPQYAQQPDYLHDPRRYPPNYPYSPRYPYPSPQDDYNRPQAPPSHDDYNYDWRVPTRPAPLHAHSAPGYMQEEALYPDTQNMSAHLQYPQSSISRQRGKNDIQNRGTDKDVDEGNEESSEAEELNRESGGRKFRRSGGK